MKCYICGQDLPEESFYSSELRARSPRCKDCHKARKREQKRKKGTISRKGIHIVVNEGKSRSIYWNSNMISELKRYYPNTSNQELVELFGVSERTLARKARELSLSKSKEYISQVNKEKSFLARITSKNINK